MKTIQQKKTHDIVQLLKQARDNAPDETARQSELRAEIKINLSKANSFFEKHGCPHVGFENELLRLQRDFKDVSQNTPKILIEYKGFKASIYNTKPALSLVIKRLRK